MADAGDVVNLEVEWEGFLEKFRGNNEESKKQIRKVNLSLCFFGDFNEKCCVNVGRSVSREERSLFCFIQCVLG